ncbi:UDP-galactose transporter senju, partial [Pseudolycoriella hygida]
RKYQKMVHKKKVCSELFPTNTSILIFIGYMSLFISQGILVTASQESNNGYNYNTVLAVLLTEVLKLIISTCLFLQEKSEHTLKTLVVSIVDGRKVLALYFVPALLYCLYNNLAFVNLSSFDPTTYYLLLQFRVVITGVLFQIIFKKYLSKRQWISLIILTIGCMIKQIHFGDEPTMTSTTMEATGEHKTKNMTGLNLSLSAVFILIQTVCSCLAGVYNEYLLKDKGSDVNIYVQNVFMYIDSIVCNIVVLVMQGNLLGAFGVESLQSIFRINVILIMINNAGIGIITSFFLKYMNSILKTFASALELLFTAVLCYFIFAMPIYLNTVLAIGVVSFAIYLYSKSPVVNVLTKTMKAPEDKRTLLRDGGANSDIDDSSLVLKFHDTMHAKDIFSKQCILCTIGVLIILFSTLFAIFWMQLFESILAKEIKLSPQSRSYDVWKTPPLPMYFDIYLFNWTNPSNFSGDEVFQKPILKQIGPYRFVEKTDKEDIVWNNNHTVSFRKKSTYYFDAANSKGQMDDMITTINIVALSAAASVIHSNNLRRKEVSVGLGLFDQLPYVTKRANELLFDGYEDDLIEFAKDLSLTDKTVSVPYDKIGWFYTRNGTSHQQGHFNMHTGGDDISQIGTMKNWNFSPKIEYFPDECGMLRGSAGEFYPPIKQKTQPTSMFIADLCRSISLDFEEEKSVHGITGYKYAGGEKMVDNGTVYPENKCFSFGESVPSGVMNVSACRFGSPVFMSFPHYYAADPYFLDQIEGLNPSKEKHEFYITLEPLTGIPLDVAARLQINMLVRPIPNVTLYQHAPHMFFPVLWFEQKVTIPNDMASEIKTVVAMPVTGYMAIAIVFVIGLILTFWWPVARMIQRKGKGYVNDENKVSAKEDIAVQSSLLSSNGHIKKIEVFNGIKAKKAPLAEKEAESELTVNRNRPRKSNLLNKLFLEGNFCVNFDSLYKHFDRVALRFFLCLFFHVSFHVRTRKRQNFLLFLE